MRYYHFISIFLIVLGWSLIMGATFYRPSSSVDLLQNELATLKQKVIELETTSILSSDKRSKSTQAKGSVHGEVLEVIRAERNIYEIIQGNERYTRNFFVSLLGVFFAGIGLFGFLGMKQLVDRIATAAEQNLIATLNGKYAVAQGALFNHMGFYQYQQYYAAQPKSDARKLFLESAISSARSAVASFDASEEEVIESNLNIKYQSIINLAYYLACRNNQDDGREALLLAARAHALAKIRRYPKWYDWEESYALVLYMFGTSHQKRYAFQLIDSLINDPEIEDLEWKASVKKEWSARRQKWDNVTAS